MTHQHQQLASGRFNDLSLAEQMANVGSEIERTIKWRNKGNQEYSLRAFERSLELLDLAVADPKNRTRLKELLRTREALADYFYFDNKYQSTDRAWQKYFSSFNYLARI